MDISTQYFEYSNSTCFSKAYLTDITYNLTLNGASFKARAEVYEACHCVADRERLNNLLPLGRRTSCHENKWKISEGDIEECWYLWVIIKTYQSYGVLNDVSIPNTVTSGNHENKLCQDCWLYIEEQPNEWILHKLCNVKGGKEGYVTTVDGNCNLRRCKKWISKTW